MTRAVLNRLMTLYVHMNRTSDMCVWYELQMILYVNPEHRLGVLIWKMCVAFDLANVQATLSEKSTQTTVSFPDIFTIRSN